MNNYLTFPFQFKNYDLVDCELYCVCGHMINLHSNGLGGGLSICECEDYDCGCCYAEFDYELTIAMNFFQGSNDRWLVAKLKTDVSKQWTMTNGGGFPMIKEPYQMVIR